MGFSILIDCHPNITMELTHNRCHQLAFWNIPELAMVNSWGISSVTKWDIPTMLNVWYIYLHNWVFFGANVGKYSIYMEHMSKGERANHDYRRVHGIDLV